MNKIRIIDNKGVEFIPLPKGDMFIGLLDSEGNDIYENDILTFPNWDIKTLDCVKFKHGTDGSGFYLQNKDGFLTEQITRGLANQSLVVGNMHENPSLMED